MATKDSEPFQFKQFAIIQDKAAMKVGTDGVLLGSWVDLPSELNSILDIGTGTGLIALMLAQRCNAELIDGVELNHDAFMQTVENFENSDWGDRLFCYHASFQEFVNEIDDKYDLIISNPPFYSSTYKELSEERAMARHTESLPTIDLLQGVSKLLSSEGSCAFIIPFSETDFFLENAKKENLFPKRITYVRGTITSEIKRTLLQLSFLECDITEKELIIEIDRHNYTREYTELVKDFYLKI